MAGFVPGSPERYAYRMGRFVAALVLMCSACLQVAAANCPVGLLTGDAGAVTTHEAFASHELGFAPHEHNSENRSCHHGNHDCSVLMTCCLAQLPAVTLSASAIQLVLGIPTVPANLYVSSNLTSDPPPPRFLI